MGAAAAVVILALGGSAYWLMNRKSPAPAPATVVQEQTAAPETAVSRPPAAVAPPAPRIPAPVEPLTVPAPPVLIKVVLGDALPVRLVLDEDIAGDSVEGDPVKFKVGHDLRVDDTIVIRKGAPALGAIVDGAKRHVFGFGKMTFRLDTVEAVDGKMVNLRATEAARTNSKHAVSNGRHTREVAAFAGADYTGYIDGANAVTVKK